MLIPVDMLSRMWNIRQADVIHVGAHLGEEMQAYYEHRWINVTWIEANPEIYSQLKEQILEKFPMANCNFINALITDTPEQTYEFKVANNGQSSSILDFDLHSKYYPEITFVKNLSLKSQKLDSILSDAAYTQDIFLNLDIQGAELLALRGCEEKIKLCGWIYTEVNKKSLYSGNAKIADIDKYLKNHHFERVSVRWVPLVHWGDALYIRKDLLNKINLNRRILNSLTQISWSINDHFKFIKWRLIRQLRRLYDRNRQKVNS